MSRDRFLDVNYRLSVLLTSLLDLSFEFVEVLRGHLSNFSTLVVVVITAPPVSRIELTNLKKRSQPAEIAIELEKLCLRVSAAALTASINSNIVETMGISQEEESVGDWMASPDFERAGHTLRFIDQIG